MHEEHNEISLYHPTLDYNEMRFKILYKMQILMVMRSLWRTEKRPQNGGSNEL